MDEWRPDVGDPVVAEHPIDGTCLLGTFLRCRGSRFCEIKVGDEEYVVSYKGLRPNIYPVDSEVEPDGRD